jgi:hypothetical protein
MAQSTSSNSVTPEGADLPPAEYSGRVSLFGFEPTPATFSLVHVPAAKRATRAALFGAGGVLAAPLVAFIPPHIPWALAVFAGGLYFARRTWQGEYTVHAARAVCPRCSEPVPFKPGEGVRFPTERSCYVCHQSLMITLNGEEP